MASIIKRCDCFGWDDCPHPWVVSYRTEGGRTSKQREQSFGDELKEAENFLLKVEHDKKAHVFIDPDAGKAVFRAEAEAWLAQRIGADSSDATYKSVLRTHVYPAIGHRQIRTIRREEIKEIIAAMNRKGLSASRVAQAHLVINAVFNEAVRNKKLSESPCTDIPVPDVVHAADFVFPEDSEMEALAAGLPADGAATVWLMYGCGLRIGEALAVKKRCRINGGTTLRVREQVNPVALEKRLKFRVEGQFRDIPLPLYVSEAIDKHIARHSTTDDGHLFRGRRHKHVTRRTYNEDFERAAGKAGLPPEFIPHTLRHCYASLPVWPTASRSPRCPAGSGTRASRSRTRSTAISCRLPGTAPAPSSTTPAAPDGTSHPRRTSPEFRSASRDALLRWERGCCVC